MFRLAKCRKELKRWKNKTSLFVVGALILWHLFPGTSIPHIQQIPPKLPPVTPKCFVNGQGNCSEKLQLGGPPAQTQKRGLGLKKAMRQFLRDFVGIIWHKKNKKKKIFSLISWIVQKRIEWIEWISLYFPLSSLSEWAEYSLLFCHLCEFSRGWASLRSTCSEALLPWQCYHSRRTFFCPPPK